MIALGPFDLVEPLGQGGMGVVWFATHRATGLAVAVKLLTTARATDEEYVDAFRNEVRAVAALDHPHVVRVHDVGTVPRSAAQASGGQLVAGAPWLAMEHCEGGTLASRRGTLGWTELRDVLLGLLDALAHAHARGVIHRDIKPGNLLLGGERPGLKLTDFGLAAPLDRLFAGPDLFPGGTPAYMAPEQIEGRWRDLGPWTDLYALGCLAWALCTGTPPFGRGAAPLQAHLEEPPPPLEPKRRVPAGFEGWLLRLLEKDPDRRMQRAADAAWSLLDLPDRVDEPDGPSLGEDDDDATLGGARTTLVWPSSVTRASASGEAPAGASARPLAVPPLPASWRRPPAAVGGLRAASLGLFGLRAVPVVGREMERDVLWTALSDVRRTGAARAVVLRGPSGSGKTRLARWLTERAHEVGSATVLEASPGEPVRGMLLRHLRLVDAPRDEVEDHVADVLLRRGERDADEHLAMAELLCPAPPELRPHEDGASGNGKSRAVRLRGATERHAVAARWLVRLAADRPVVVHLDDPTADGLGFARFLVELEAPILVVVTVADEALPERPDDEKALTALLARPSTTRLDVGPLPADAQRRLLREHLGLSADLAARVEACSAGNPLFAVHVVGDLLSRGLLEVGDDGFRPRPDVEVGLPEDLHAVWSARIERVLDRRPPDDAFALEIAATLGLEVEGDEWRGACAAAGVDASADLVDALVRQRLAVPGPEGTRKWAFVHGMLRESVERRAREAGRASACARACAAMLCRKGLLASPERLGRYLLAAGDLEGAVDPLLAAAKAQHDAGDPGAASTLLRDRERAMAALGVPEDDRRWTDGFVLRCVVEQHWGDIAMAQLLAERAVRGAQRIGDLALEATARRQLGRVLRRRGDLERARTVLDEAVSLARRAGDLATEAGALSEIGWVHLRLGHVDDARRYATASLEAFSRSLRGGVASALMQLGEIERQAGDYGAAERWLYEARRRFQADGVRWGVASCCNALGELMRTRGDLERAEALYREAWERYVALGETDAAFPEANLGIVLVEAGRYAEARRQLEPCLQRAQKNDLWRLAAGVQAALLACAAGERDWKAFDRHLAEATAHGTESGLVDADNARFAQRAGDMAREAGLLTRARSAYSLARSQWMTLGRDAEARAAGESLLAT